MNHMYTKHLQNDYSTMICNWQSTQAACCKHDNMKEAYFVCARGPDHFVVLSCQHKGKILSTFVFRAVSGQTPSNLDALIVITQCTMLTLHSEESRLSITVMCPCPALPSFISPNLTPLIYLCNF